MPLNANGMNGVVDVDNDGGVDDDGGGAHDQMNVNDVDRVTQVVDSYGAIQVISICHFHGIHSLHFSAFYPTRFHDVDDCGDGAYLPCDVD